VNTKKDGEPTLDTTSAENITIDKTAEPVSGPDPFDLDALRLDPAFEETAGVRKVLSTVPVRKPHKQEWFRVHPDLAYRGNFSFIKLEEEGEFYLLTPDIARDFEQEAVPMTIYTCINSGGVVLLWPCRIASAEGRQSAWHSSAHEAAAAGMEQRIRLQANMGLGAYEWNTSTSPTVGIDPVWPDVPFTELVRLAFVKVGRYVSTPEHPVIKQLRGD
jgi:hypothetical protein